MRVGIRLRSFNYLDGVSRWDFLESLWHRRTFLIIAFGVRSFFLYVLVCVS